MGAACCKKLDPPASPQLPLCEVLRRIARQICPLDPPTQKQVSRTRKYGLSDITGPVVKRDSWAQTDPQPPPRRRKKKAKKKRSRSVEFLPYRLTDSNSRRSSGSLGNITGQEDAIDFQMYFMSRLPRNSLSSNEEVKESISGRKKDFLSGLLGEENNNHPGPTSDPSLSPEVNEQSKAKLEIDPEGEVNSRRSSITESLKEFESSLLDMLQDDEEDAKDKEPESTRVFSSSPKVTPLKEEKEDGYILSPLEEETEDDLWDVNNFVNNYDSYKKKDRCKVVLLSEDNKASYEKQNKLEDKSSESKIIENQGIQKIENSTKTELPVISVNKVS